MRWGVRMEGGGGGGGWNRGSGGSRRDEVLFLQFIFSDTLHNWAVHLHP